MRAVDTKSTHKVFGDARGIRLVCGPRRVIMRLSLPDEAADVVHLALSRIIISETNDEQFIVLKEVDGERAFPIVIGIWEAVAIDRNIKGKKTPRPMTHDLIENVIAGLDCSLDRIVVTELKDRTFYARLILRRNGKMVEVDSRPSDAIALAVQMKAPIYVNESVLDEVTPNGGIGGLGGTMDAGPEEEGEQSGDEEKE